MQEERNSKINLILNVVLMIAVIVLFVLHYTNNAGSKSSDSNGNDGIEMDTVEQVITQAIMPGDFSIAYVNTDSLMAQYGFYQDANKEIELFEVRLQQQYEGSAKKLQDDYDNYVRQGKAGLLSLQQQKDTEARLQQQQEQLMAMEQSLGQESNMKRQSVSTKVTDTILSFLETYRVEHNYTLILQHGAMSGLLSATPDLDVTKDVVKRLNAKYEFDKNHQ
jgi:outer membrane protein